MTAAEIALAAVWLAVVVGGATATGTLAAVLRDGDRLDRWFTGWFAAIAELLAASVLLACAGLFSRWWIFSFQVAAGCAAGAVGRRRPRSPDRGSPTTARRSKLEGTHVLAGLATAFFVLTIGVALPSGRSEHFESFHYHFAGVAHLVTTHSLWSLPFQNPAFFTANHPQNAELLLGVVAQATGGDELIYTAALPLFGALMLLAGMVIGRATGSPAWIGGLAVLSVLSTPMVFGTQARSIATDLPAAAFLVAAVAFVVSGTAGRMPVLLAGAALGAALGTKYTVLVPVAFVALLALARLRLRSCLSLLPGLLVLGAPWFLRNWAATGNPLFPQHVDLAGAVVFAGGATPLARYSNTFASLVVDGETTAMRLWATFVRDFYGPVAVVAAFGSLAALLARGRGIDVTSRRVVAGVALVAAFAYSATPYTGAGDPPLPFLMGSNLRYALPAIVLGSLAAAAALPRLLVLAALGVAGGWSIWRLVDHPIRPDVSLPPALLGAAGVCALAPLLIGLLCPLGPGQRRRPLGTAGAAGSASVLTLAFAAAALAGPRSDVGVSPLERALDARTTDGQVVAVGVDDLRGVIGAGFARTPVALTSGPAHASEPFPSPAALARAMDGQPLDVVVVGVDEHPGVPDGFEASAKWCAAADVRGVRVYERRGAGRCD